MNPIIKKILIVTAFLLALSPQAFAEPLNGEDTNDSIYRYNALESQMSFAYAFPNFSNNSEESKTTLEEDFADETDQNLADKVASELKDITEKQNFSMEQIDTAMDTLKNQNLVKTLIIGNNLGILKFQLAQISDLISLLQMLGDKNADNEQKIGIDNQIKVLESEKNKVESFVVEQERQFSLLGWFTRML